MQISELLKHSTQQLATLSASPRLDAEILLAHSLQKPRSYLYTWPEQHLDTATSARYQALMTRRISGQPIAYLIGYREFWGLKLIVNPATLIPRPETELLVETALAKLTPAKHRQPIKILDLGTGSGAIAIALAAELPEANITATDRCTEALAVARDNAKQYKLSNICFVESDWFSAISQSEKFDLIVSNPPYIATNDPHLAHGDTRFEPETALVSGTDGLNAIRYLITHAKTFLLDSGLLILEHGYHQAAAINTMLQYADYQLTACRKDLSGNDRVSYGHYYTPTTHK